MSIRFYRSTSDLGPYSKVAASNIGLSQSGPVLSTSRQETVRSAYLGDDGCYGDGYRASVPQPESLRFAPTSSGAPLRVIHVGTHLLPAGIDQWFNALRRYSNPQKTEFVRYVVTTDLVDQAQVARMQVPVEVGGRDSVRKACEDCDVLLVSDPGANADWFSAVRPPLSVFVAHGDCHWTRERLESMTPVVDHVIAVSRRVQENMCFDVPTTVIHNGVDPQRLTATHPRNTVRQSLGFHDEDFVIGFVGRFSEEKNPAAIIHAVAQLPPQFKALMVGFGHLRCPLMDLANQLIPGRYAFIRGGDNLGNLYSAMDAFTLVSESEGYGLVIMEALMCGKPVIVRPIGFVPEFIENRRNGLIVTGTPESIVAAAQDLANDKSLAESVSQAAHVTAQNHGFASTMAQRFDDLLSTLWEQRSVTSG
ncbi:glycosyltransferase family 4 protein [Fuerstiella marisgermanici]|uniref:D-inositol 3-phosphate glycosyltransferase n=1 Tax=Fuerstiella marisgermanici TaxID=1891926 RepID=A0A1P8WMK5_9PLAN|nr:glycosyltransferase family 4 protein [Fuerstiella marisgermanici]APZ95288.1 D-inositol 3-phosphate glycosyltransferase [Fuerstiella marisgermanici]